MEVVFRKVNVVYITLVKLTARDFGKVNIERNVLLKRRRVYMKLVFHV
jgi:hypothetical protein